MSRTLMALVLSLGCLAAPSKAVDVEVRTIGGGVFPAQTLAMDEDGLSVGNERIPFDQLFSIEARGGGPAVVADDTVALLRDGSTLVGRLRDGREDYLALETGSLGDVSIPVDALSVVVFGAPGERVDPLSLPKAEGEEDVVYRRSGIQGDFIAGTVLRAGREGVTVDSDLGEIGLALSAVLGVSIAALGDDPRDYRRPIEIELADKGRLTAGLLDLTSAHVVVSTAFGARIPVPFERIRRVRFSSGLLSYLSDLDPTEVSERPFIGGSDDFLFPWRRDASVTGEPLTVAGRTFGKGLGMHSRTSLTFAIDEGLTRFVAQAGVSDEVLDHPIHGALVVRVLVDGESRYESPALRPGAPAVPIEVDVSGGARLTVEVDFGERGDLGDRAVLGDAMLLKDG